MRSLLFNTKTKRVVDVSLQKRKRKQRTALWTLGISLAIGLRWHYANREPIYPKSENIYRSNTLSNNEDTTRQANAAHFYVTAAEVLPDGLDRIHYDLTLAQQKDAIQKSAQSLQLIHEGVRHPYYGMEEWKLSPANAGRNTLIPDYRSFRALGRLLATESSVKRRTGDKDGALSVMADEIHFGLDLQQGQSLIEGMVGKLALSIALSEAFDLSKDASAPIARDAITRLESLMPRSRNCAQLIAMERDRIYRESQKRWNDPEQIIALYDAERSIWTTSVERVEPTTTWGKAWHRISRRAIYDSLVFIYTKQGLINDYSAAMDQQIARGKMTYQQAKSLGPVQFSQILRNPWVYQMVPLSPGPNRIHFHCTELEARAQIIKGKFALQAYSKEHNGKFPQSLDALTQGNHPYLKSIPYDPFAKIENTPLFYTKENRLYSVGENGIDNHGTGDDQFF